MYCCELLLEAATTKRYRVRKGDGCRVIGKEMGETRRGIERGKEMGEMGRRWVRRNEMMRD